MPALGFLTEPLPRGAGKPHPDLEARLAQSLRLDPRNFDRIVSFDPLFVEAAAALAPVWRSVPLPVDDSLFGPVQHVRGAAAGRVRRTLDRAPRALPRAGQAPLRHPAIAHGVHGRAAVSSCFGATDVGINLHNEPYPSFENRVCLHLAAGNLVISEPLSPTHGLEPGIDYLEVGSPRALHLIDQIHHYPDLYRRVRIRGRRKAEASVLRTCIRGSARPVPRPAVFGTERPGSAFA